MTHNEAVLHFKKKFNYLITYPESALTDGEKKDRDAAIALEMKEIGDENGRE